MRRHETDVTSLVFGVLFTGVAGLWALAAADWVSWPDIGVLAPVLLIGAGVAGLVVSLVGGRRRDRAIAAEAAGLDPADLESPDAEPADALELDEPTDTADPAVDEEPTDAPR